MSSSSIYRVARHFEAFLTNGGHTLELRGFFAVDREAVHESEQWKSQLNEYINNHEDIIFFLVDDHPLHICRAHPEARQILTNAEIPADFRCPFARDSLCPFEQALTLSAHRPITLRLCPCKS